MLIDSFAPKPDFVEVHSVTIPATRAGVYRALWTADFASPLIKALMYLRALPAFVSRRCRARPQSRSITLESIIDSGFLLMAEDREIEVVLGVCGKFWRPTGNIASATLKDFNRPVPPGFARALWNFSLEERAGVTILTTETRVICGDLSSRRKFAAYWLFVRPFSGLIRRIMLSRVREASTSHG
jgi:hypothetical protein